MPANSAHRAILSTSWSLSLTRKRTKAYSTLPAAPPGFLISSYKHILKANTNEQGHSTLTPDERGRLADNFKGYDISPDMVRLSLVNMYLHGFADPHISEYDTLTSEENWNDYADVILANPAIHVAKRRHSPAQPLLRSVPNAAKCYLSITWPNI